MKVKNVMGNEYSGTRQKYAEGNKAWHALSEEEKQQYNERGKGVGMNGYCLFMSEFTAGRLPTIPIIA